MMTEPPVMRPERLVDSYVRTQNRLDRMQIELGKFLSDEELMRTYLEEAVPLDSLIDVNLLVNRHLLRLEGINVDKIRVASGEETQSVPELNLLILESKLFETLSNEGIYVIIAHELTHFKQVLSGELPLEKILETVKHEPLHSRRSHEQEAIFWEAQQAAKFQWSREDLKEAIRALRPERGYETERYERTFAALPVLSRRPVRVRQYRRRFK